MRPLFTWEHEAYRETVRSFLRAEVEPHADAWWEAGLVDREVYRKAGAAGLLLTWADESYGGQGIDDFRYEQVLMEEMPRWGDPGLFFTLHSRIVAPYLARLGSDEQKARWLPGCASGETILGIAITEPDAGSDVAGIKTRARDLGDHFRLDGSKTYVSNGIHGDLFVVAARTLPDEPHGLGLFVVERGMAGFERGKKLKKLGLHSQDTAELFFDGVEVPKENLLGDPTRGFRYLMEGLAEERLICAVHSLAAAREALRLTVGYVQDRQLFGRRLAAFQNTRFQLAGLDAEVEAAHAYLDQCVLELVGGGLAPETAARVKLVTTELEGRVTDACVQLHGGAGYMAEHKVARLYANARVSRIYAGSNEIMREIIARSILPEPE